MNLFSLNFPQNQADKAFYEILPTNFDYYIKSKKIKILIISSFTAFLKILILYFPRNLNTVSVN
jgi:hypothetical protein